MHSTSSSEMVRLTVITVAGMAVRLAFDLGLHAPTQQYVDEAAMTREEARARSRTMWGCYINDWFAHTLYRSWAIVKLTA